MAIFLRVVGRPVAVLLVLFVYLSVSRLDLRLLTTSIGSLVNSDTSIFASLFPDAAPTPLGNAGDGAVALSGGREKPDQRIVDKNHLASPESTTDEVQPQFVLGTNPETTIAPVETPSSQTGEVVDGAKPAPALRLQLSANLVERLLGTGKAVIIARNDGVPWYIMSVDGRFVPSNSERLALVSNRAFVINDISLIENWRLSLKADSQNDALEFDLNFTNSMEAEILRRQLESVVAAGINFDESTGAGRLVVTTGEFDEDTLAFRVIRADVY
jgi:hypothetical protein